MLDDIALLAVDPDTFVRRFRNNPMGLVYDPRSGKGTGRIISEDRAVAAITDYTLLFRKLHRTLYRGAKWFILVVFVLIAVIPITGQYSTIALEVTLTIGFLAVAITNYRLRRFLRNFWKEIERGVTPERLSRREQIQRGYRLGFKNASLFALAVALYIVVRGYAEFGDEDWMLRWLGLGKHGHIVHRVFLVLLLVGVPAAAIVALTLKKIWNSRRP